MTYSAWRKAYERYALCAQCRAFQAWPAALHSPAPSISGLIASSAHSAVNQLGSGANIGDARKKHWPSPGNRRPSWTQWDPKLAIGC